MKQIYKLFLIFIALFIFPLFVNAESCSKEEKSRINKLINNIDFTYTHTGNNYFTISIYNIPDELYILSPTGEKMYPSDNNQASVDYYLGGNNYTFRLFSINGNKCIDDMNYTKTVYVKKYNVYSKREICKNSKYTDFKYCNEWYQGNITNEKFETELKKYEKNLIEKDEIVDDSVEDTNNNIFNKNIIIVIGSVVLLVVVIIMLMIRRKKRRKL